MKKKEKCVVAYFRFNTVEKYQAFLSIPGIKEQLKTQEYVLNNPNPLEILEPTYRKNYDLLLYNCADKTNKKNKINS